MRPTQADGLRSKAASTYRGLWYTPGHPSATRKVILNCDSGVPDPTLFPVKDFLSATAEAFKHDPRGVSQYGNLSHGFEGLRDQIAARTSATGTKRIDRESVMLTSGSAQAISLTLASYLDPGDVIIVEAPTWGYVLRDIQIAGACTVAVSMDKDGLLLDELEDTLRNLKAEGARPKLIYTIATFNNPMGTVLSFQRRKRLLEIAQHWGLIVLADDTYGEVRFEGEPIPSLFELDESGLVLNAGTFSKTIGPALRMGWVLGDPRTLNALAGMRRDLGPSQIIARALAEYLAAGKYDPHVAMVNAIYHQKRDRMRACLAEFCAPYLTFNNPPGGFYLWLELAPNVDPLKLRALAAEKGVTCRPGEATFPDGRGKRNLRAAFSSASMQDIEQGVALLGQALAASVS